MSIYKQKTQYRSFPRHILLFELSQTLVHNPILPLPLGWWYGCIMLCQLQLCCCLLLPHRLHKLEDVGAMFTHKFCELQGGWSCSPLYFIETPASLVVSVDLYLKYLKSYLEDTQYLLPFGPVHLHRNLCTWQTASHICLSQIRPHPSSILLCRYRYRVLSNTKHRIIHGENVSAYK